MNDGVRWGTSRLKKDGLSGYLPDPAKTLLEQATNGPVPETTGWQGRPSHSGVV